jgi:hypothetical protein
VSVEIFVDADHLKLELRGWDRVWAMRGGIEVPFGVVLSAGVQARRSLVDQLAVRIRGTTIPGRVLAGSYSVWPHARAEKGDRHFWVTRRAPELVAIETSVGRPRRIVVEVKDPYELVRQIDSLLAERGSNDLN